MAAVLLGGNELARRTQEFRGYEAVGARATCSLEPIQPIAHDFWFHHPKEGTAIVPGFNRDDSLGFEQVIVRYRCSWQAQQSRVRTADARVRSDVRSARDLDFAFSTPNRMCATKHLPLVKRFCR